MPCTVRDDTRVPAPERRHPQTTGPSGNALGAVVFTIVLLAIAVGGYLWLQGRNARLDASQIRPSGHSGRTADKWTGRLGKFLRTGPTSGTWETRSLSCVYTSYVAPHPTEPESFIIAQVGAGGAKRPLVVSRWLVPRHFFRAPAHLFFSNYERTEGPIRDELDDGTKTWRVHWGPRDEREGLTERIVWFSVVGGEVVQIEDRSRSGHLLRRVRRIARDTGLWDPRHLRTEDLEHVVTKEPTADADPEQRLQHSCTEAPFDVYEPTYLPSGFVLVRSSYTVADAALTPSERPAATDGPDAKDVSPVAPAKSPVQLVSQLYSDGLALISVGVAPREDMNTIEVLTAGMADADDPASCPGLPGEPRDIRQNGSVIRMRRDTCRIVLRRDDLLGVSVTIIGRRELPDDEYLRMIGSMKKIAPVR